MGETPVHVAYPAADDPHLRIALGACRFTASSGEGEEWISGTYHDPTDRRPLRISEEEAGATITEAEPSFERIPAVFGGVPRYELEFGKERSFALTIETGASKFELDFSYPNPGRMELLDVSTGAAGLELENLANANFSEMRLSGGAASYDLDFSGTLSHDAEVSIETGLSAVTVSVPASTAARVAAEATLGRVDVGDGFTKKEGVFLTEPALSGDRHVLRIRAGVRLGSLQLRTV